MLIFGTAVGTILWNSTCVCLTSELSPACSLIFWLIIICYGMVNRGKLISVWWRVRCIELIKHTLKVQSPLLLFSFSFLSAPEMVADQGFRLIVFKTIASNSTSVGYLLQELQDHLSKEQRWNGRRNMSKNKEPAQITTKQPITTSVDTSKPKNVHSTSILAAELADPWVHTNNLSTTTADVWGYTGYV